MRDGDLLRHGCNHAAHIEGRNQPDGAFRDIRTNHHDRRCITTAEFRRQFPEKLLLVSTQVNDDLHQFMGYIGADELVVRPVLRHILVHDFEQFLVADNGIPPGMHGTNLFVAELDTRSTFAFCENEV